MHAANEAPMPCCKASSGSADNAGLAEKIEDKVELIALIRSVIATYSICVQAATCPQGSFHLSSFV
jgi:hypothetical protein